MTAVLAVLAGMLFAIGTYLLLQRTLTRVLLGIALLGHGANLLLLGAGGPAGAPAFVEGEVAPPLAGVAPGVADPLPQALALTAIVISFAVLSLLLALAYRSWVVSRSDEVEDDVEDRRIAALVDRDGSER